MSGRPVRDSPTSLTVADDSCEVVVPLALSLLGSFRVVVGGTSRAMPSSAQRLLGFLALHANHRDRAGVAASLWLDVDDVRARRYLRDAIWQVRRVHSALITQEGDHVRLGDTVVVDVRSMADFARALGSDDLTMPDPAVDLFSSDLLPDWSDEWVVVERERIRQLRLHALENLCRRCTRLGHHAAAIDAAVVAVAAEPLRESAQRVLIEAHLAENNVSEAALQLERYRTVLRSTLGVAPSDQLVALVTAALRNGDPHRQGP